MHLLKRTMSHSFWLIKVEVVSNVQLIDFIITFSHCVTKVACVTSVTENPLCDDAS